MIREYVGTGEVAEGLAHADEAARLERERAHAEDRARDRAELERLENLAAPIFELSELVEILARAHLTVDGYRNHKGEWRRRRGV